MSEIRGTTHKREREKYWSYKRDFDIDDTSRANLFFFGVETMGAIGPEAQKFCMLLAKLSGGYFSHKITYIYQRLSVMLQGLRSHQIYDTLANYSSNRGGREVAVVGEGIQIEADRVAV
jgi:hypothetical protein